MVVWHKRPDFVLKQAFILVSIFWRHLDSLEACVKHVGSIGVVAKSAMRQVGMRYQVASQTFDVLVLSCVLMTI